MDYHKNERVLTPMRWDAILQESLPSKPSSNAIIFPFQCAFFPKNKDWKTKNQTEKPKLYAIVYCNSLLQ